MKIGKTQEELDASKIYECRTIVKNIVNFGVSESQKIQIIKLLSLELDSRDSMQKIISVIQEIKSANPEVNFSLTEKIFYV